jgi:hypothetical protein
LEGIAGSDCGADIKYSKNGGEPWGTAAGSDVTTIRWNLGTIGPVSYPNSTGKCYFTVNVKP